MIKYSLSALAAAGLLAGTMATSATAADLGGNCCADLEERIAELEATTARKGNRKVSLTVTGWVSSQIYWFDSGVESNVYVVDNANDLSSNFKFTGSATISPGWKAGYSLWIYADPGNSLQSDNDNDTGGIGLAIENSYWFIQSDQLGKVSVGRQSLAADNAALGTDFSGTLFPANSVTFDGGFFPLVDANTNAVQAARWENAGFWCEHAGIGIGNDCAGLRLNGVRYDTPTFAGFSLSASWGEDDYWDIAARYSGEFSGIKVSLATAYSETTDNAGNRPCIGTGVGPCADNSYFQVGGMVKHLASGLWVHGTYGINEVDDPAVLNDIVGWYLKAGWSNKFSTLGATHFYGEYGKNEDAFDTGLTLNASAITGSDATRYGVGVVQEIDAAAMSLWAKYRHHEYDASLANGTVFTAKDVDMFLAGAVIFY